MAVSLEIVVAWFDEDLSWLVSVTERTHPRAVYVYDKGRHERADVQASDWYQSVRQLLGETGDVQVRSLPNVGREGHTYLQHVIDHYRDEADTAAAAVEEHARNVDVAKKLPENRIVMFLQGRPHDHLAQYGPSVSDPAELVQLCYEDALRNGVSKSTLGTVHVHPDFKISVHGGRPVGLPSPLTFGEWFEQNVALSAGNASVRTHRHLWWTGAQFAVSWSHALTRPLAYYQRLHELMSVHVDPEIGHFLERSWYYIFDRSGIDYTILPFYSGLEMTPSGVQQVDDNKLHSRTDLRAIYLRHTLRNVARFTRCKVVVGVCSEYDEQLARKVAGADNSFVQVVNLAVHVGPDPKLLPLALNAVMQRQQFFRDSDVVYFTNADQLLCGRDIDVHLRRLCAVPVGNAVLVPHRLEEMYRGHGVTRGMSASISKRMYVLPNSDPKRTDAPGAVLPAGYNDVAKTRTYYNAKTANEAYAAAFIAEFKTYRKVPFVVHHGMPLESPCFSVFYAGKVAVPRPDGTSPAPSPQDAVSCIKTSEALQLYVIHLSGFEHHAMQADEKISADDLYIPPVHASTTYSLNYTLSS